MFCLEDRKSFKTVGELKQILNILPDDSEIFVNQNTGWFHIDYHKQLATLESGPMPEEYKWYDFFPSFSYQQYDEYFNDLDLW